MQRVRPGEVPPDGGTAVQDDADRPVFSGNGPDDYVCVECGNVLATSMSSEYMTFRVRVHADFEQANSYSQFQSGQLRLYETNTCNFTFPTMCSMRAFVN